MQTLSTDVSAAPCARCEGWHDDEHHAWNLQVRGESGVQRLDRNFAELLQEVRVAQTGVQILFAFLLGLAFTSRFPSLDRVQQGVYVVSLVLSAVAAAMLLAPVMYHRLTFRRRLRAHVVVVTHRLAIAGLVTVLLAMVGSVHLAVSLVLGTWAAPLAASLALLLAGLWFGLPTAHRRLHATPSRSTRPDDRQEHRT